MKGSLEKLFIINKDDVLKLIEKDQDYKQLYERFSIPDRQCYHTFFEALVKTVISQQLSNAALKTLLGRIDKKALSDPTLMLKSLENGTLKLSLVKRECIEHICHDFLNNNLNEQMPHLINRDMLKERLLAYKGIGPWSVDIIFMFYLQDRSIFAKSDFGIRRGFAILKNLDIKAVKDAQLKAYGESLGECATIACFYLWELSSSTDVWSVSSAQSDFHCAR